MPDQKRFSKFVSAVSPISILTVFVQFNKEKMGLLHRGTADAK
jgi:hypothetical protein